MTLRSFLLVSTAITCLLLLYACPKRTRSTPTMPRIQPTVTPTPVNRPANVMSVVIDKTTISLPCAPGLRPANGAVCPEGSTILVMTSASDPENDVLTYNYTVSGGRIVGSGERVTWDLSGVSAGTYTITAGADDGQGVLGTTKTETVRVEQCDCVSPCACASLDVSGPTGITGPGELMVFTANVSGAVTGTTFNWTVSAGTIESGQGTPTITVRVPTEDAESITATVEIGGADLCAECPRVDSETAAVAPLRGMISGNVKRAGRNTFLTGAKVTIIREDGFETFKFSEAGGRFTFPMITANVFYTIKVTLSGYRDYVSEPFMLEPGANLPNSNIELRPR